MFMIAAALEEELQAAKSLCSSIERIHREKAKLWQGVLHGENVILLRTGIGPKRSAERLKEALEISKPSHILLIGYAGALDPSLKLGTLVEVTKAISLRLDDERHGWEHAHVEGEFELMPCDFVLQLAAAADLSAAKGDILTSPHVLGKPSDKQLLRDRFHAAVVDMETAALARIAQSEGIPLCCMRVVSDEAEDSFLAPFSYDPSSGIPARAVQLMSAGLAGAYREWRTHSTVANERLTRFLTAYLIRDL